MRSWITPVAPLCASAIVADTRQSSAVKLTKVESLKISL
jgi:hypothetical protein